MEQNHCPVQSALCSCISLGKAGLSRWIQGPSVQPFVPKGRKQDKRKYRKRLWFGYQLRPALMGSTRPLVLMFQMAPCRERKQKGSPWHNSVHSLKTSLWAYEFRNTRKYSRVWWNGFYMKEGYLGFNFVHTTDKIAWFCVLKQCF